MCSSDLKYSYVFYKSDILVKAVSGNDWIVPGVANDNGSGVQTVTAKLEIGSSSQNVTMTRFGYRASVCVRYQQR